MKIHVAEHVVVDLTDKEILCCCGWSYAMPLAEKVLDGNKDLLLDEYNKHREAR